MSYKNQEAREKLRSVFSTMSKGGVITEEPEFEPDEEIEVMTDASGFKSTRPVATLNRALEQAEFGHFNLWLLATCGGVVFIAQFLPIYLVYKAPTVECDLGFHGDANRNHINVMVYIGLTLGALVTGILADIYRRNIVLVFALALHLSGTVLIALQGGFTTFWLGRLFMSFGGSGAVVVAVVILAEYNLPQHRAAAVCSVQLFWVVGTVAGPVLNMQWANAALLSCVLTIVLIFSALGLPENPRYLLSVNDAPGAFASLRVMYAYNTGSRETDYPPQGVRDNETLARLRARVGDKLVPEYMKPRYYTYPLVIIMQFFLMFSYYCLMPYFPALPSRYDAFYVVKDYIHEGSVDSCALSEDRSSAVLQEYHAMSPPAVALNTSAARGVARATRDVSDQDCYPHTPQIYSERRLQQFVMVAFAAIPAVVWLVMSVDNQGRKFFVSFAHVIAAALIYSSYFLMRTRYDLVFACGFEAMVTFSVAGSQVLMVELAKTRVRATALAVWFFVGYVGLVLGNWGLGMALQISCNILLGVLGILVSFTGMFTFVCPDTVGMPLRS